MKYIFTIMFSVKFMKLTSSYTHNIEFLFCIDIAYRQTSNISHNSVGNKIVDHSDVDGASPVGDDLVTIHIYSSGIWKISSVDWPLEFRS